MNKNYEVEATKLFTDKETKARRNIGDRFVCDEKRYNVLKQNNAVKLIQVIEEDVVTEEEVQAVAVAIVEQAEEENKTIDEVVNEIVEELVESDEVNKIIDEVVEETIDNVFLGKNKKKKK